MRSFGFGFWVGLAASLLLSSLLWQRNRTWAVELPGQPGLSPAANTPTSEPQADITPLHS